MADYYKTLEVNKTSSADEIKSSYRKLALKYHPDRNAGDKAAEEKFKEISEAYAVLSDPEKKKQYDMFGDNAFHQKYSSEDIFRGTDFSSVFSEFGMGGGANFEDILGSLFGGAGYGRPQGGFRQRAPQKGQDVEYPLTIGFMDAYSGSERRVSFRLNEGTERNISLKIPAGTKDGTKMRVAGRGAPSPSGGQPGDLYVTVHVAPHPQFKRVDDNIETPLRLKLTEALLGSSKEVETPDGKKKIKVPAGVGVGTKIRLKGLGFPSSHGRGDLFAVAEIELPGKLSQQQKEAVEALQEVGL